MSRARHVPSRWLFVAGTITSYAAAKQQDAMLEGDALICDVARFPDSIAMNLNARFSGSSCREPETSSCIMQRSPERKKSWNAAIF
ncbi:MULTISPECIES: hypothetical protein [unclassified Bradyrhizobium]|uniref:hypothetical protein n=1 Tax=unclassified Bradyrhizobium TaxID=2631580 RepID=UPI0020B342C2|nr:MULTISPECIES: hypothetical protein [unclassified Bradyrhizobium]MCP3383930.1 hypothetical protein [Bradyrhizobium sp. CCGUVB4N]MCP3445015.1 hypothetical protein [Bradyrhizobium sp. CCGUVB14]